jgi:hypothetical protein
MRILAIAILVLASITNSSAQIRRGSILLSGSFDVNDMDNLHLTQIADVESASGVTLTFKAGYFVVKNGLLALDYERRSYLEDVNVRLIGRYYYRGKIIMGAGYNASENAAFFESGYAFFIAPFVAIEPTVTFEPSEDDIGINVCVSFFLNRNRSRD